MTIKNTLSIIFVMLLSARSFSQTGTIKGTIKSVNSQLAEWVNVGLKGTNKGGVTNANGEFEIKNVEPGNYTIFTSVIGYESFEQYINVKANETTLLNITLKENTNQLKGVTVTAEKKPESLQNVPISVTVLDSKKLTESRTWNTNDITALVPNLFTQNEGSMYMYNSLRGISAYSYEPVIQTYVDDVPQFSLFSAYHQLFDVEHMEVLRGPQGTLYGRNAIGGVINVISKQPSNIVKGRAEITYGNYNQQRYSLALSGPLVKNKLYLGGNITYNSRDGYIRNTFTNRNVEGNNTYSSNLQLKYNINPKWNVTLVGKYDRMQTIGVGIIYNDSIAMANKYTIRHTDDPIITRTLVNGSMVIKRNGNRTSFTSVSAINSVKVDYKGKYDYDASEYEEYYGAYNSYGAPDKEKNLYQEFRLASVDNENSKLRWIAGAVAYQTNERKKYENWTGIDAAAWDSLAPYAQLVDGNTTNVGFAGFGQLSYSPVKKLSLTVGLRYDNENKTLARQTADFSPTTPIVYNPTQTFKGNFDAISPKFSVAYTFSKKLMSYLSYNRGFRAGGLNWATNDDKQRLYQPEKSDNFEAGLKSNFWKNKIQWYTSLFFMKYKDIQAYTFLSLLYGGGYANVGTSTNKGIETELTANLIKGLKIEANLGYTSAVYNDFIVHDGTTNVNYKSKMALYTPRITSMSAIQYAQPFKMKGKDCVATIRGEYRYTDKVYFSFDNNSFTPAYGLIHSQISIENQYVSLAFWGRNLANTYYSSSVYTWGPVIKGTPRMMGVTLTGKF